MKQYTLQFICLRDYSDEKWEVDIFNKYDSNCSTYKYQCFRQGWSYCIPYLNNEHLYGTTDTPKEMQ